MITARPRGQFNAARSRRATGAKPRRRFAESGFRGPFPLDKFLIEAIVDGTGVYALVERSRSTGALITIYVGRGQLRRRLIAHAAAARAEQFMVRRVSSTVDAFHRECGLYRRYGRCAGLDNLVAPARPWLGMTACRE